LRSKIKVFIKVVSRTYLTLRVLRSRPPEMKEKHEKKRGMEEEEEEEEDETE